jgi:hypothetical protein
LVGSIYWRTFTEIAHFLPIRQQIWLPLVILVCDWSISKILLWNFLAKWTEIWWEAPMEGNVLSFLKSSKQNERCATQAQPTEPLFHSYDISVATRFGVVLILSCISFSSSVSCGVDSLVYFLL